MSQCASGLCAVGSMASLSFLLLSAALIHFTQSLPAARGAGRGLDVSVGGGRRERRDLHNLLPYQEQMMSYAANQGGGGANHLYYQSDGWRGRGLNQALQRLMERDQREEQEEEQQAGFLGVLLRLLSEAQSAGLVDPGDVEEEEKEEDNRGPPGDFRGHFPDYDETGGGTNVGRPLAAWWGLLEPHMAQALLERMEPHMAQAVLQRARPQQGGRLQSGRTAGDQDSLRRLVARLLSSIGPSDAAVISGRRMRRDLSITAVEPVGSAHVRSYRSLDDVAPPFPSNSPPLLRGKRLEEEEEEEEEEEPRPPAAELQRMKRIHTMATAREEELHHGSRRRRKRDAVNYDTQIIINQILEYMRE
ncbi:proprotein convertase subtilisin/kexin type 1 inhibitor, like isoform X2 [Gasterosteus aculeatus]